MSLRLQASASPTAWHYPLSTGQGAVMIERRSSAKPGDKQPATATRHRRLPSGKCRIRSRNDLSFTRRDASGRLINWMLPQRAGEWHEHYGIGESWFDEVVQLARHDPEEAYTALRMAGPLLLPYMNFGHAEGFFNRMAQWAIAAMLSGAPEPSLPFKLPALGDEPHPGLQFYRSGKP